MVDSVAIAGAVRVLSQPLLDLYNAGKDRFDGKLDKWKNASAKRGLANKVAAFQKVKTFWQRDKQVSLSSFYYPSRVSFEPGSTKNVLSLRDLPQSGNLVIQGTIGQGKSIFLRYLCIQELKESGSGRIPVFFELRLLTGTGIVSAIHSALDRLGFEVNETLFDFYAESGKLVILLDAFDEIEESLIKQTINDLEYLAEKYPKLQIIITSRPDSAIQSSRLFRVIQLAGLDHDVHHAFFTRIGIKNEGANKLVAAIDASSSEISGLLSTPLMLTLLAIVYQAESSIPSELPDFFDSLFQTLFTKHDKSKPGLVRTQKSGLSERKFQQLFQAFCFSTLQLSSRTVLSNEEFHNIFAKALKHVETGCEPESFKHDIIKVVCLMQEEGYESHFIHKSVLEFYAASFVRHLNEDAAVRFYAQLAQKQELFTKWRQVIHFLSKIDRFRYTKYFAIPCVVHGLSYFGITPPYTEIDGEKIIKIAFEGTKVGFLPADDRGYRQSAFGPFGPFPIFFQNMGDVSNTLFFDDEVHVLLTREELTKKYPMIEEEFKFKPHLGALVVPWHVVASPSQLKTIRAEAVSIINEAVAKLHELNSYLSNEDEKADLLLI